MQRALSCHQCMGCEAGLPFPSGAYYANTSYNDYLHRGVLSELLIFPTRLIGHSVFNRKATAAHPAWPPCHSNSQGKPCVRHRVQAIQGLSKRLSGLAKQMNVRVAAEWLAWKETQTIYITTKRKMLASVCHAAGETGKCSGLSAIRPWTGRSFREFASARACLSACAYWVCGCVGMRVCVRELVRVLVRVFVPDNQPR